MELDVRLMDMAQILKNISTIEREGGMNPILHDFKKVVQAVNYLLEHSNIIQEVHN